MTGKYLLLAALAATAGVAGSAASAKSPPAQAAPAERHRLIVLTDIGNEPDDSESMVRLLTYANEIEIEGLVAATSRHLHDAVHPEMIEKRIAAYEKMLPNLRVHDPRYPDAARLRSVVRAWRPALGMQGVGEGKDNPASQLIIDAVDKADARPVWVSVWGGAAPLAQALWTVRATRSPEAVERFVARLRVYSISDQDDSGPWARAMFPKLFWIASIHGPTQYGLAAWNGISVVTPGADQSMVNRNWLRANVRSKGDLGATYPLPVFIMEGDTPSFLGLVPNGLSVPERPDWGGWGGRWEQPSPAFGLWADTTDQAEGVDGKTYNGNKVTIWRWRSAFQADFAMRMAWSVTPRFADANHAPRVVVNGLAGDAPIRIAACPGDPVALDASASSDPDRQPLSFRWWSYREPSGLWSPEIRLSNKTGPTTSASVPVWTQPGLADLPPVYSQHLIVEASDTGAPALVRYRRVIVDLPTDGRTVNGKPCPRIAMAPAKTVDYDSEPAVATDRYSQDSDIGTLVDDPRARAILVRTAPALIETADGRPEVRGMTLRVLKQLDPRMTEALVAEIEAALAGLAPAAR